MADKQAFFNKRQMLFTAIRTLRMGSISPAREHNRLSTADKTIGAWRYALTAKEWSRGVSPKSFHLVVAILLLASVACSLSPDDQTSAETPALEATESDEAVSEPTLEVVEAAPQPTPTQPPTAIPPPDFFDLDGNPVYNEPPPQEVVELMLAQVEAGDIELEDGVLGLLRLLANEGSLPAYAEDAGGDLVFDSGWGLSLMAYELYQSSDDPDLRAELDRLLRKLAPPQEALDLYAVPAESYSGGTGPGLHRVIDMQISCSEIWHEGFPDSAGPVPTCLLYDWFIAGGFEFRVYYPVELTSDNEAMARVAAALEALKLSQEVYSKLVEVRSINLVFSLVGAEVVGGSQSGVAMVPHFAPGGLGSLPCPITVFNAAKDAALPNFKQIIAHEVFHCIHLWRKGVSGYSDMKWYNEGMANYFSNVVYPKVNHENKFVALFHGDSMTDSIFEMTYGNTVFFQYLGNQYGDPWLIELLDGMPSEKGAMVSYMASQPDMELVFHEFAQAYMETKIADTGGGFLPGSPLFWPGKSVNYPGAGPLRLEAKPFHIERARLEFEKEMIYELDLNLEGDPARQSAKLPQGSWEPLPDTITSCDDLLQYLVVVTSTATGSVSSTAATFNIDLAESEEIQCDACLIGEWELDYAADEYWDAVRRETADMETQLESVEGIHRLIFYENGLYESHTEDFILVWRGPTVTGPLGDQSSQVITTRWRSAFGHYHTVEISSLVMVEMAYELEEKTDVLALGVIVGSGGDERIESGESTSTEPPEPKPYTCTPSTLSLSAEAEIFGGGGKMWSGERVYTRVSSVPPPPTFSSEE